mmetsp:Transcript_58567/g.139354  ORF Transcript_58567/g.139354 Transcript_58567/m.139354 type:complete len:213 (-) Transcript_58567:34-672(-)
MTIDTSGMVMEDSARLVDRITLQWPGSAGERAKSCSSRGTVECRIITCSGVSPGLAFACSRSSCTSAMGSIPGRNTRMHSPGVPWLRMSAIMIFLISTDIRVLTAWRDLALLKPISDFVTEGPHDVRSFGNSTMISSWKMSKTGKRRVPTKIGGGTSTSVPEKYSPKRPACSVADITTSRIDACFWRMILIRRLRRSVSIARSCTSSRTMWE